MALPTATATPNDIIHLDEFLYNQGINPESPEGQDLAKSTTLTAKSKLDDPFKDEVLLENVEVYREVENPADGELPFELTPHTSNILLSLPLGTETKVLTKGQMLFFRVDDTHYVGTVKTTLDSSATSNVGFAGSETKAGGLDMNGIFQEATFADAEKSQEIKVQVDSLVAQMTEQLSEDGEIQIGQIPTVAYLIQTAIRQQFGDDILNAFVQPSKTNDNKVKFTVMLMPPMEVKVNFTDEYGTTSHFLHEGPTVSEEQRTYHDQFFGKATYNQTIRGLQRFVENQEHDDHHYADLDSLVDIYMDEGGEYAQINLDIYTVSPQTPQVIEVKNPQGQTIKLLYPPSMQDDELALDYLQQINGMDLNNSDNLKNCPFAMETPPNNANVVKNIKELGRLSDTTNFYLLDANLPMQFGLLPSNDNPETGDLFMQYAVIAYPQKDLLENFSISPATLPARIGLDADKIKKILLGDKTFFNREDLEKGNQKLRQIITDAGYVLTNTIGFSPQYDKKTKRYTLTIDIPLAKLSKDQITDFTANPFPMVVKDTSDKKIVEQYDALKEAAKALMPKDGFFDVNGYLLADKVDRFMQLVLQNLGATVLIGENAFIDIKGAKNSKKEDIADGFLDSFYFQLIPGDPYHFMPHAGGAGSLTKGGGGYFNVGAHFDVQGKKPGHTWFGGAEYGYNATPLANGSNFESHNLSLNLGHTIAQPGGTDTLSGFVNMQYGIHTFTLPLAGSDSMQIKDPNFIPSGGLYYTRRFYINGGYGKFTPSLTLGARYVGNDQLDNQGPWVDAGAGGTIRFKRGAIDFTGGVRLNPQQLAEGPDSRPTSPVLGFGRLHAENTWDFKSAAIPTSFVLEGAAALIGPNAPTGEMNTPLGGLMTTSNTGIAPYSPFQAFLNPRLEIKPVESITLGLGPVGQFSNNGVLTGGLFSVTGDIPYVGPVTLGAGAAAAFPMGDNTGCNPTGILQFQMGK